MKYTALAVLFLLACVVIGTRFPAVAQRPVVAIGLAAAMVGAQFALLVWT